MRSADYERFGLQGCGRRPVDSDRLSADEGRLHSLNGVVATPKSKPLPPPATLETIAGSAALDEVLACLRAQPVSVPQLRVAATGGLSGPLVAFRAPDWTAYFWWRRAGQGGVMMLNRTAVQRRTVPVDGKRVLQSGSRWALCTQYSGAQDAQVSAVRAYQGAGTSRWAVRPRFAGKSTKWGVDVRVVR